jgi:hypothetical protein
MKQERARGVFLQDDGATKIVSSLFHAPVVRMTSHRVTFEIPFH